MIDYNQRIVDRLEARWLDPDCVDSFKDDEAGFDRADDEADERWMERMNND